MISQLLAEFGLYWFLKLVMYRIHINKTSYKNIDAENYS